MSTRAQVYVTEQMTDENGFETVIHHKNYYHHDGYLTGVGSEILESLQETEENLDLGGDIIEQFNDCLTAHHELGEYEPEDPNGPAHGDVEFVYDIRFEEEDITIFVTRFILNPGLEFETKTDIYTVDQLDRAINGELAIKDAAR